MIQVVTFDHNLKFHIFFKKVDECLYRLRWISCCEPIINTIASKSGVLYITVLLIAEKNKEVCFIASDLFHFNIQIQPEKNVILSLYLSLSLSRHYSRTRVFATCAQWVARDPMSLHADSEDWSDWADLSLCWAHSSFCWFFRSVAHM